MTRKSKKIRHRKTTVFFQIPVHVKAQFKGACSRRDKTMTEEVINFMRSYYRQDKRAPKPKERE